MRIYLPATMPLLQQWWSQGSAPATEAAYAVTPAIREWYRDGDSEELEHVAQLAAARGSLELLAHDLAAPRRRVVIAADVPDATVRPRPQTARAAIAVGAPVPVSSWACALVDEPDAAAVVAAAVAALARAAVGDEEQAALDDVEAVDLGWYAVQELPELVDAD